MNRLCFTHLRPFLLRRRPIIIANIIVYWHWSAYIHLMWPHIRIVDFQSNSTVKLENQHRRRMKITRSITFKKGGRRMKLEEIDI